jgi:predicted RNase H-like HicB family nuclease
MSETKLILQPSARLFIGNLQIVLPAETPFIIEGDHSPDAIAELLAGNNQVVYAQVRDQLAHEEVVEREVDGQRGLVVIAVTYGVGGSRNEEILRLFVATTTEQIEGREAVFAPQEGGGFVVTVPSLPGVVTEGDTLEEARTQAADAIRGYLESVAKEKGEGGEGAPNTGSIN